MRIQHNVMAMNAYRNYSNNTKALSKNLERLSSGYKINRAGDDAAGLAISEKMRAQITGLEAAQKNVKDGISLVNTAEGAMQEVQDMLNRMVYLAQESANGTYDNEVDRLNLQKEMDQLNSEINRIADSANFNGIKLLDGSLGVNSSAFTVAAGAAPVEGADISADMIKTAMPDDGTTKATDTILHEAGVEGKLGEFTVDLSQLTATPGAGKTASVNITIQGVGTAITVAAGAADTVLTGKDIATGLAGKANGTAGYLLMNAGNAKIDTAANAKKGDLAYQATDNGDGTVTFKAVGYAAADGAITAFTDANMDKLSEVADANFKHLGTAVTAVATTPADTTLTGAENIAATNVADSVKPGATTFGNTFLTIDVENIEKGMKLTIAGETKEFGKDIKIDDLDLTDADDQKDLMERITQAFADNQHVSVGTDTATVGKLTLAEKTDGKGAAAKSLASEEYQKKMSTLDGFKSMVSFTAADTKASTDLTVTASAINEGDGVTVGDKTYVFTAKKDLIGTTTGNTVYLDKAKAVDELETALKADGYTVTKTGSKLNIEAKEADATEGPAILGKGLTLQIGDTSDPYNQLSVVIGDIHANKLGTAQLSIATQQAAADAVDKIKNAINTISGIRGTLGATSNRLDHTANNLSVMRENITDAESAIRDTDIAEEMMAYTKNNILVQSAQAMLAQANQVPQGVLQLLQ